MAREGGSYIIEDGKRVLKERTQSAPPKGKAAGKGKTAGKAAAKSTKSKEG
ncbi:hypothetical protein [Marinihelvus fidelis]|uniref:hypothetical protein n=1 Tax=Marinihelvus fidelis TaxID=2613842 RepID=UPI00177BC0A0|nr:hypothetical protein [Marinihelvus fidelis]